MPPGSTIERDTDGDRRKRLGDDPAGSRRSRRCTSGDSDEVPLRSTAGADHHQQRTETSDETEGPPDRRDEEVPDPVDDRVRALVATDRAHGCAAQDHHDREDADGDDRRPPDAADRRPAVGVDQYCRHEQSNREQREQPRECVDEFRIPDEVGREALVAEVCERQSDVGGLGGPIGRDRADHTGDDGADVEDAQHELVRILGRQRSVELRRRQSDRARQCVTADDTDGHLVDERLDRDEVGIQGDDLGADLSTQHVADVVALTQLVHLARERRGVEHRSIEVTGGNRQGEQHGPDDEEHPGQDRAH